MEKQHIKEKTMVFKKKKAAAAKADACPKGACTCCCGCSAKKIIGKVLVLILIIFATAKVTTCMMAHKMRAFGHGPHAMMMKKGCECGEKDEKRGGFFHRRGPKGGAPERPAE